MNTYVISEQQVAEPQALKPVLRYAEAADLLGVSPDVVRGLVASGVLDRPSWSYESPKLAIVTTSSVYRASGWPIVPLATVVNSTTISGSSNLDDPTNEVASSGVARSGPDRRPDGPTTASGPGYGRGARSGSQAMRRAAGR